MGCSGSRVGSSLPGLFLASFLGNSRRIRRRTGFGVTADSKVRSAPSYLGTPGLFQVYLSSVGKPHPQDLGQGHGYSTSSFLLSRQGAGNESGLGGYAFLLRCSVRHTCPPERGSRCVGQAPFPPTLQPLAGSPVAVKSTAQVPKGRAAWLGARHTEDRARCRGTWEARSFQGRHYHE